jgi:hypothetical protein
MDKFLDVKAQVYPLRRYSVFKNFQSEMDGAEELLQSLIRGEKTINKETLDLKLIAFLIVFENFADAKEPAVWEWESDPDFDRLGQILKGTTANFDKAEKRWILENSQMYLQGVAAQNFEAGRGSRALNVATKNGAWAITLLSVQTVLWWAHARSLIQMSDRIFKEEAVLIQQAVKNGAGTVESVTEIIQGLSRPMIAAESTSFASHLAVSLSGRDMGREAVLLIQPQAVQEIATKMPKGLNPAALDAITAAVQQRQFLFGFAAFISKTA